MECDRILEVRSGDLEALQFRGEVYCEMGMVERVETGKRGNA